MTDMQSVKISKGGQISIPADVRRRWGTARLLLDDRGDALVLRPLPADPIAAAMGSLAGGPTSDELRARARADDEVAERRRYRR